MTELSLSGYRVVAVHAHPDDESLFTGGALHQLARRGADVTVVTCTLGEEGEVIGDTYRHLVADAADQLGGFRIGELRESLRILGVRGRFLGGAGAYRDSGMAGSPAHENPRAFVNSGQSAVTELAGILRTIAPHLVITYGPDGGYGHPDHIRAHEITHAATASLPEGTVGRIAWAVTEAAELQAGLLAIEQIPEGWRRADEEIARVASSDLAIELSAADYAAKATAMRAHATQLWLADGSVSETNPRAAWGRSGRDEYLFALSNLIAQPLARREHYQLGDGAPWPEGATDLCAGL